MSEFIEIKANKRSLSRRESVYGFGVNDSPYMVKIKINGKQLMCPYYQKWVSMLNRCYSDKYHEKRPTYIGCTVADEWIYFMAFRSWMENKDWKGNSLDKDILVIGNKNYGPETCIFIPQDLNSLLNDHVANRGPYPQGVTLHEGTGKYVSRIMINGKKKHISLFDTPEEAYKAYCKDKSTHIYKIAYQQKDIRLRDALIRHGNLYILGKVA